VLVRGGLKHERKRGKPLSEEGLYIAVIVGLEGEKLTDSFHTFYLKGKIEMES